MSFNRIDDFLQCFMSVFNTAAILIGAKSTSAIRAVRFLAIMLSARLINKYNSEAACRHACAMLSPLHKLIVRLQYCIVVAHVQRATGKRYCWNQPRAIRVIFVAIARPSTPSTVTAADEYHSAIVGNWIYLGLASH